MTLTHDVFDLFMWLIRVFAVHSVGDWEPKLSSFGQRRLLMLIIVSHIVGLNYIGHLRHSDIFDNW